ncbi:Zinc finger, RING/FYVE/PHD-type [Phytophthora cactorum]|nr:Zinc finger, RING/FYVE/PHD-type [Phytophthora cactorum]KAF1780422.1 Zinc finger, RING/FYVE/PHD-type [Phytophthora cactorum]KAF1780424.1 Zinc finger, RING/FYVE/PHD-type [Phytophthora cactorum]
MASTFAMGTRAYVPLSVAWLERLAFSFSAQKVKRDVRYILSAEHLPSGRRWAVVYSFDACRVFQRRLARALSVGHRCDAPCPWLYSFVTSYFPKPRLFHSASSDRLVQKRCEALVAYIKTLQSSLLSRASHSCRVVTGSVAEALLDFVCGGDTEQFPIKQWAFAGQQHRARGSVHSLTSTSDEGDDSMTSSSRSLRSLRSCSGLTSASSFIDMCSTYTLEADIPVARASDTTTALKTCTLCDEAMEAADDHYYYTTRLHCGHRFHDECLILQLNINMSCPTCHQSVTNDM